MKLSRAVLCLIALLGLSTVEAGSGYMCVVKCGAASRCDPQKMEELGRECPSSEERANHYRNCMERCHEQLRAEIETENKAKQKRFLENQLRRERQRERGQKH